MGLSSFTEVFVEMDNKPCGFVIGGNEFSYCFLIEPAILSVSFAPKQSKPLNMPSLLKQKADPTYFDLRVMGRKQRLLTIHLVVSLFSLQGTPPSLAKMAVSMFGRNKLNAGLEMFSFQITCEVMPSYNNISFMR
jgi:hypothetical protein